MMTDCSIAPIICTNDIVKNAEIYVVGIYTI